MNDYNKEVNEFSQICTQCGMMDCKCVDKFNKRHSMKNPQNVVGSYQRSGYSLSQPQNINSSLNKHRGKFRHLFNHQI